MRPPSKPNENAQLRVIAEWLDRASRWLEEEVRDNRERDLVEGVSNSHCYRLAYASQREDRYDRASRRANNIRMRLGGEPGTASLFPNRPKGMHDETYGRLKSAVLSAEVLAEEQLAIVLARLHRSDRGRKHRSIGRPRKEFWR